jgi:hypothetical protein
MPIKLYNRLFSSEGKGLLGRLRRRWNDNIRTYLVGQEGVHWIQLAHDRVIVTGSSEHNNKPSGSIKAGNLTR